MLFLFFQAEAGIRDAHLGLGFRRVLFRSLAEEKLILVTTDADGALLPGQYVYVDWGPAFAANHQAAFPELSSPPVSISLGPLALGYLLSVGGAGYFRDRKGVVWGKGVSVRVDLGGRSLLKTKIQDTN